MRWTELASLVNATRSAHDRVIDLPQEDHDATSIPETAAHALRARGAGRRAASPDCAGPGEGRWPISCWPPWWTPTTMRSGTMHAKITADHLERTALVYVRQSTTGQVRDHTESRRRQYGLVDVARELGFHRVETIDDDLGISGSGFAERPGFQRLLIRGNARRLLGRGRSTGGGRGGVPRGERCVWAAPLSSRCRCRGAGSVAIDKERLRAVIDSGSDIDEWDDCNPPGEDLQPHRSPTLRDLHDRHP
jgi:Resolvase, N terminal domain